MPPAVADQVAASVAPFGIAACNRQNCDLLLQSIPGCRLRGEISPSTVNATDGRVRTPQVQQQSPPAVPGMELHVNPARLSYTITDPLQDDEAAQGRIKAFIKLTQGIDLPVRGVAAQKGTLDKHRMKTLVREMIWLVEAGDARVVKGALPTMEAMEDLDGDLLLNPGSVVHNSQPRFEKDFESWCDRLSLSGG